MVVLTYKGKVFLPKQTHFAHIIFIAALKCSRQAARLIRNLAFVGRGKPQVFQREFNENHLPISVRIITFAIGL